MANLIKLITGEEILAKILTDDTGFIIVENPVKLALSQKGVAMVPLSPFVKEGAKFTISKRDVIYVVEADDDVVNAYNGQFGGIMIAPPGLTLG